MISATVTGNLGKDAEVRQTRVGPVCSFNVASSKKIKGEQHTTWVRCSLFGKRGEALSQYLSKGTKVAVAGELSTREYEGKTYVELNVSEVDLMGGGNGSSGGRSPQRREEPAESSGGDYGFGEPDYSAGTDDDDIPF